MLYISVPTCRLNCVQIFAALMIDFLLQWRIMSICGFIALINIASERQLNFSREKIMGNQLDAIIKLSIGRQLLKMDIIFHHMTLFYKSSMCAVYI